MSEDFILIESMNIKQKKEGHTHIIPHTMRPKTGEFSWSEGPSDKSFFLVQPGKVTGFPGLFQSTREFLAWE